jgi:type III secretion protein R
MGSSSLVFAVALLSLLPFVFLGLTAFVKIGTVLHIVRSAIGVPQVPSNTVVTVLAAALTVLAMAPVGDRIVEGAAPLVARGGETSTVVREVIPVVVEPLRSFFKANASPREQARFFAVAQKARPAHERARVGPDDLTVLAPAFVVTELAEAFSLGFMLYLPFLVLELVVANVLVALGMPMVSPTQVSLPFKLLLFVAIDGWGVLAQSLVAGYR